MLADPAFLQLATLLSAANRGMTFDRAMVAEISPLLHTLPTLTTVRRWAAMLEILDVLSLCTSGRTLCSVEFSQGLICESDEEPMNRTCIFLRENLHRNVSLDEISSVAGMSTSTFSRFFRRVSGLSFVQYVNELKMRTASMLLLETDAPVRAVASSSGFASTSYFHRRFVQAKGVTPADFRATYLNHSNTSATTGPATSVNRKSRPIAR